MALFIFMFGLYSIIKMYHPNPLTAVVFFIRAAYAALVSTYLLLFYVPAGGAVYGPA